MPNNALLILAVVLVLLAAAAILFKKIGGARTTDTVTAAGNDYQLRAAILTPAERSFLGVLEPLLPENVGYLVKVRLADVVTTRKGLDPAQRTRAQNRINQKHVDFLLVRTSDLKPLAGIELDDASHDAEDRQRRDKFVDGVFQSCKTPLLHVTARATYNPNDLQASITEILARG